MLFGEHIRGGHIRIAALALTASVIATLSTVVTATPAQADQGLAETGKARYVVPDNGKPVTVTQVLTLTNRKPSTATRYFFWTGYSLWLPSGATKPRATSQGSTVPLVVTKHEGLSYADLSFPSSLQYGQSRTITVTYTIPGAPPRSARPGRVGRGYAAFDVFSPGDAGQATIEIVAPRWMTLDLGVEYTEKTVGEDRVATATGGGPTGLSALMSLRDPSQAAKRTVTVDDHTFSVVGFPGDTQWSAHIGKHLPGTVRELERLTGQQWPNTTTTISEDFSRQVYGWDGAYERGNIDVSEALSPSLLAHELAHAWSNYDKLDQRWLTEGLAQELTTQAMAALRGKDDLHAKVSPKQKNAFPLADWADNGGSATDAESYGYAASWRVVHDLVAGSTEVPKPELIRALTTNRTIYDAPSESPVAKHATSWQQAYDLFEVLGGNTRTRTLMTTWVIASKDAQVLTARGTARKAYAAQDQLDGSWALPRGVRSSMADWDFTGAGRALTLTRDLATRADSAQKLATRYGVDATTVRAAYQAADATPEYREVGTQLSTFNRQVESYGAIRTDLDAANPLALLGATVVAPADAVAQAKTAIEKGDTKAADKALESAESKAGMATGVGAALVAGLLVLLAGLAFVVRRLRRRRRSRAAIAQAVAPEVAPAVTPEVSAAGPDRDPDGPGDVDHPGAVDQAGDEDPAVPVGSVGSGALAQGQAAGQP